MAIAVVIPAYNESLTIGGVVNECRKYTDEVIVVNDGSVDETEVVACTQGAWVVTHMVNRGYGAALKTGIVAALRRGADIVVTIDADGQHEPREIPILVSPLLPRSVIASERSERGDLAEIASSALPPRNDVMDRADIVIGNRFANASKREGMSILRKLYISIGNFITWILYGVWLRDTQSGFRAYTRDALVRLRLEAEGMEFSSEVIGEAARLNMRIVLIPITVHYTDYSLGKGQNFVTGVGTALKLLLRRFVR